jgi:Ala-tRNA(Pro) deacylase
MALNQRLQQLLDQLGVPYSVIPHKPADTAMGVAHTAHLAGRRVAKVVIVRDRDGQDIMVVIPAIEHVDHQAVRRVTGHEGIQLEDEKALKVLFPDCEVGAMPPFGALYDIPMYLDRCLAREEDIYFQGGNHHELVRMPFADYEHIAKPIVEGICLHAQPVAALR